MFHYILYILLDRLSGTSFSLKMLLANKENLFLKVKILPLRKSIGKIHTFHIVFLLKMYFMKLSSRVLFELHEVGYFFFTLN